MKHMIQPFGIDMHKNVLTDTKAVKHMHFYEADKTNTILNISFIPSSTTEWIICYNDNNDISEFICIGCQNIFTTLSLKEFDHYFGIRFDNTGCYFNKGCDIKTYPVNITDNIFRYEPAPQSYEMQLIKDFHNSSSFKDRITLFKAFVTDCKTFCPVSENIEKLNRLIRYQYCCRIISRIRIFCKTYIKTLQRSLWYWCEGFYQNVQIPECPCSHNC